MSEREREIDIDDMEIHRDQAGSPADLDFPLKTDSNEFPLNPESGTEAFRFHQKRFKKIAEDENKKLTNRIRDKKITEVDVAHEEALRDNADFERRKSEEMKEWEIRNQVAIRRLKAKRDDPEGEGKEYTILVLIWGGGLKVINSAGQLTAMHYMGFEDVVDEVRGISGGGPVGAYYVAGKENGPKGTSLLPEEATDKEFFDPTRLSQVLDIKYMGGHMRHGPKSLDQERVKRSPTKLFTAINRDGSSEMEWVEVKSLPDMISGLEATGNVPFFRGEGIEIQGRPAYDGAFGQIDLKKIIEESGANTIIILPNNPFDEVENIGPGLVQSLFAKILPKHGMTGFFKKYTLMAKELRKVVEEAQKELGVNIAIFWTPDTGIKATTNDPAKLEAAIYENARATFKAFGEEPQDVKLFRTRQK